MKISIAGLGWFGSALAHELKNTYHIRGTTRTEAKARAFEAESIACEILLASQTPSQSLLEADVLVLNIPPFAEELEWFKSWQWWPKTHLIFISSTSVYGEEEFILDENHLPKPVTENGLVLLKEEEWVKTFPHWTIIRPGGLFGPDRHPGKYLSGRKNLAGGNQPVNLIHQNDLVGFTKLVIEQKITGEIFNLVAPEHPSRREYYTAHCQRNNLPLPEFVDSPLPGKTISSQKASKLYQFKVHL